jgi:TetR/AcrR family transcriptional regulator, transcriptional repressor for nem operon
VAVNNSASSTRDALLRAAEHLVRSRGYSAFSYADLSEAVGVRKASIHHHFPLKADLGCALVEEYTARFEGACAEIESRHDSAVNRIRAYGKIYAESIRGGHLCLCGMLATELSVLPGDVPERVRAFFSAQLEWLQRTIAMGQARGAFSKQRSAKHGAEHVLGTLQGSMLLGWVSSDPKAVERAVEALLLFLKS